MQCPYVGLTNQSSTCYMNSYLQYLYMQKEFRSMLFSLDLKPEKPEDEKDSIPYQLQKLFAKLNLQKNKQVSTKALTQSFQWGNSETFVEHDVSEFSKILHQAIRESLNSETADNFDLFSRLNEGKSSGIIKCLKCGHKRENETSFNEIHMVIKNEFEKIYCKKLESSLLENIKTIRLEGDNAVFCEKCDEKQTVEKGSEYREFPDIVTLNLNRFVFDMQTFQRKKLDDYFEFPLVIDFDSFVGPCEEVRQKHKIHTTSDIPFEKNAEISKANHKSSQNVLSTNKGKRHGNKKTSSKTKAFLKSMRRKNKKNKEVNVEFKIDPKTEQYLNEKSETMEDKLSDQILYQPDMTIEESSSVNLQEQKNTNEIANLLPNESKKVETNSNNEKKANKSTDNENDKTNCITKDDFLKSNKSKSELIELNEETNGNENMYSLQAVFIHKGSAYSGHYYVYIKSFETNLWYLFNDNQVQEVNITDVLKDGFGGHRMDISAYMLAYKRVKLRKLQDDSKYKTVLENHNCPESLSKVILAEMKKEQELNKKKFGTTSKKKVKHKIFYKLETVTVEIELKNTFKEFEDKCYELLKVKENRENCRLRLYHKFKDEMQNDYDGKKDKKLSQLKLTTLKSFIFEIKESGEEFKAYNPNILTVKMVFWTEKADQIDFEPTYSNIEINKNATVSDFCEAVKSKYLFNEDKDHTINLVLKNTLKNGIIKPENCSDKMTKKLSDFYINNNTVVYIDHQPVTDKSPSNWISFFESENNKIIINFNYPLEENEDQSGVKYDHKMKIDLSIAARELKDKLREFFKIDPEKDFIIKKGGKSGTELKDFNKVIRSFNIINNSYIFLVFGESTSANEIKAKIYVCSSKISSVRYDLQRKISFVKEMNINPFFTPKKLLESIWNKLPSIYPYINFEECGDGYEPYDKKEISEKYYNGKPIDKLSNKLILNPNFTRIRERNGDILTKSFQNYSLKNQQVFERKNLVIEPFVDKLDNSEILIYFTELDCKSLTLLPVKEVIVNKKFNLREFSNALFEHGLSIPIEELQATKIRDVREFVVEDILDHNFYVMDKNDMLLSSAPFYLESGGCLFV